MARREAMMQGLGRVLHAVDTGEPMIDDEQEPISPTQEETAPKEEPKPKTEDTRDVGVLSAEAMRQAAEASAQSIERATDRVIAIANEIKREGEQFAARIREGADVMAVKITSYAEMTRGVKDQFQKQQEVIDEFAKTIF